MPKEYLNPNGLFPSARFGFSQIITSVGGKMVFLSGQVGWDQHQQIVGPDDLHAQTGQAFRNIETAMKAAGGSLTDIVSLRIYFVEKKLEQLDGIQESLQEFFPPERAPTTTWIGVPVLASREFLVEVEAVGVIE